MGLCVLRSLWVEVRQRAGQVECLQGVQLVVVVVAVQVVRGAGGDGGGGGEQAGPGVEVAGQLHAAAVVARKRDAPSSSGVACALYGLCTGHLTGSLVNLTIRGEKVSVCRSETDGNGLTSEIKMCQNKQRSRPAADRTKMRKVRSGEMYHSKFFPVKIVCRLYCLGFPSCFTP